MKKKLDPKVKRVLAIIALILMALLIAGLIASVAKKAAPGTILAYLFGIMVVPCVFYAIIKFGEISKKK